MAHDERTAEAPRVRAIPVGVGVLLASALLVVFVSGSLLTASLLNNARMAETVAEPLMDAAVRETETRLQALFDPIRRRILSDYTAIRHGLVDIDNTSAMKDLLLPGLYPMPQVGSAMIGDLAGRQFLAMRYDEAAYRSPLLAGIAHQLPPPGTGTQQFFTREVRPAEWGERSTWTLWADDGRTRMTSWEMPLPGYDPRQRPWHQVALRHFRDVSLQDALADPTGLIAWTDVYTLFTTKSPGISASAAARSPDGRVLIVAHDLLLDEIATFTARSTPTERGQVFVITDDGRLLGPPTQVGQDGELRRKAILQPVADSPFLVAAGAVARWRGQGDRTPVRMRTVLADERWWMGIEPFMVGSGTRLWIGVLLPEDDLLPAVRASRANILRVGGAALGVAALLTVLTARWISGPLRQLAEQSRRITQIDLGDAPPVRTHFAELSALSGALAEMRRALRNHMAEGDVARARIEERERQLRTLAENTPDLILRFDRDGRLLFANPAVERALRRTSGDLLGLPAAALPLPPEAARKLEEAMVAVFATACASAFDFTASLTEGIRAFDARLSPEIAPHGTVASVVVVARDVTDRRAAESALRRSEERYRSLIESSLAGIIVVQHGRIRFANTTAARLFGVEVSALVNDTTGRAGLVAATPSQEPSGGPGLSPALRDRPIDRPDGTRRWVQVSATDLEWEGAPAHIVFVRDVTDLHTATERQEELAEQLRQAQKLEAVGLLAGGVAHDFNNLLQVIGGNAALIGPDSSGPEIEESLSEIRHAVQRASQMTRQLLAFSKRQRLNPEVVDLQELASAHVRMLGRMMPENIRLDLEVSPKPVRVRADRGSLEQVLLNLCLNARDAMPAGGEIRIVVGTAATDPMATDARPAREGRWARLEVTDTGHGIDAGILPRIFEPFFSTKGREKGTGLGLSVVYGVMQQHDGRIDVRTQPGKGSTFTVHLPLFEGDAPDPARRGESVAPARRGTVLLAEDNEQVRSLATRILARAGYTVMAAADGREACTLCDATEAPIDLLFFDLLMPGLSGAEAAAHCRARRPEARVLFASGYAAETLSLGASIPENALVLQKPYEPGQLLAALDAVLAPPGGVTGPEAGPSATA